MVESAYFPASSAVTNSEAEATLSAICFTFFHDSLSLILSKNR